MGSNYCRLLLTRVDVPSLPQALAQCQLESETEMRESKSKGAGVPGQKGTADESF